MMAKILSMASMLLAAILVQPVHTHFCGEIFPLIFVNDTYETSILAAKATWDDNNYLHMFIAGSTMNPDLVQESAPLAHRRAWVAQYRHPWSSSQNSFLNSIKWFKVFESNTDLSAVVSLDQNRRQTQSNRDVDFDPTTDGSEQFYPLLALIESMSQTLYLGIINDQDGSTVRQYKILKQDGVTAESTFTVPFHQIAWVNWSSIHGLLYLPFNLVNQTTSVPAYGVVKLLFSQLSASASSTIMHVFRCENAVLPEECQVHAFTAASNSDSYIGGVRTSDGITNSIFIHLVQSNTLRWTFLVNQDPTDTDIRKIKRLASNYNVCWGVTESTATEKPLVLFITRRYHYQPNTYDIYDFPVEVETIIAASLNIDSENNAFHVLAKKADNSLVLAYFNASSLQVTYGSFNPYPGDASGFIANAVFDDLHAESDFRDLVLFGNANSLSFSNFTWTGSTATPFITPVKSNGLMQTTYGSLFTSTVQDITDQTTTYSSKISIKSTYYINFVNYNSNEPDFVMFINDTNHDGYYCSCNDHSQETITAFQDRVQINSLFALNSMSLASNSSKISSYVNPYLIIGPEFSNVTIWSEPGLLSFQNEAPYTCNNKMAKSSVVSTFENLTTTSSYPVVTVVNHRLPSENLTFNFTDQDYSYVGKMTVNLTLYTMDKLYNHSILFDVIRISKCQSMYAKQTFNLTNLEFNLFKDEIVLQTWNRSSNEYNLGCLQPNFTVQTRMAGGSTWYQLNTSLVVGDFVTFNNDTQLTFSDLGFLYGYPTYSGYANQTFEFKISTTNEFTLFQGEPNDGFFNITVHGCVITASQVHSNVTIVAMRNLEWTEYIGSYQASCGGIEEYTAEQNDTSPIPSLTNFDGRMNVVNQHWNSTLKFVVYTYAFSNNYFAHYTYRIKIVAKARADFYSTTPKYAYHEHVLNLTVVANCSGYPFYNKSENALRYENYTGVQYNFTLTDPVLNLTIPKFINLDRFCNQSFTLTAQKNYSNGSTSILSSADRDLLLTFNEHLWKDVNLPHSIEVQQDWFVFEGNYTVSLSSAVIENGGRDNDTMSFDLEVRHWCYKASIQTTAVADFDYYIQDTTHPLLDQTLQPTVVQIPKFASSWTYNGVTYSDTNNLTASCGPWNHQMYEVLANGTEVLLNHPAITVDLANASALSISVSSTDKTLINSTTGYTTVNLKMYGHMGTYFDHNSSISFSVHLRDPCFMVTYTNSTEFPDLMFYKPNFPAVTYNFDRFLDIVVDTNLSQPSGYTYTDQFYCGQFTYDVLYDDRVSTYNPEFMTFRYDYGKQQGSVYLQTNNKDFQTTTHSMVLRITNQGYGGYLVYYYPFTIQLGACQISFVTPPPVQKITYLLKTGTGSFPFAATYVQSPDCKYAYTLTAQWVNGTSLQGSVVQFSFDQSKLEMEFKVTAEGKPMDGSYQIQVNFIVSNIFQEFTDSSLLVDLDLKYTKFKLDHLPPSYQDESLVPKQIRMKTGEVEEFETGGASEDTIKSFFEVEAEKDNWKDFITIEEQPDIFGYKITIAPTLPDHRGTFSLRITLEDNGSDSKDGPGEDYYGDSLTRMYKISLIVKTEVESDFEGVQIGEETSEQARTKRKQCFSNCDPILELVSISQSGEVTIEFDRDMQVPEAYSDWGNDQIEVSIIPGLEQNSSYLTFNWTVSKFSSRFLKLQLNFDNPIRISTADTKDILLIKFLRPTLLIDQEYGLFIKKRNYKRRIPLQIDQSSGSQGQAALAENLEKGMNSVVFSNLAINIVMSSSLQFLWGMINALSINLHLPAMNVKMPGNAQSIQSILVTITQFELIPEEYLKYLYVFQKSEESQEPKRARMLQEQEAQPTGEDLYQENNLSQMGYESTLMLDNLQTVFVMMEIYFFFLVVLAILRLLSIRFAYFRPKYQWLYDQMLWNMVFRFLIEMYLELAFDCLVNLNPKYTPLPESLYEWVSHAMSWACLVLLFVFPMYILIFFSCKSEEDLAQDKALFERQGSIYEGLKLRGKQGKFYYIFFMFRRLQLAVFIVFFADYAWFQLQMSLATSTVMILFNGKSRPWDERFLNKLELINETSVLLMTYHLLMFTDYYRDVEVTYFVLGNSYIYCTFFIICLNTSVIIQEFIRANRAKCKKQKKIDNYLKNIRELRNMVKETEKVTGVNTMQQKRETYLNALAAQERMNDKNGVILQKCNDLGIVMEHQSESESDKSYDAALKAPRHHPSSSNAQLPKINLGILSKKQQMIQEQMKENMFMCQIKELTDPTARPNKLAQFIMKKEKARRERQKRQNEQLFILDSLRLE